MSYTGAPSLPAADTLPSLQAGVLSAQISGDHEGTSDPGPGTSDLGSGTSGLGFGTSGLGSGIPEGDSRSSWQSESLDTESLETIDESPASSASGPGWVEDASSPEQSVSGHMNLVGMNHTNITMMIPRAIPSALPSAQVLPSNRAFDQAAHRSSGAHSSSRSGRNGNSDSGGGFDRPLVGADSGEQGLLQGSNRVSASTRPPNTPSKSAAPQLQSRTSSLGTAELIPNVDRPSVDMETLVPAWGAAIAAAAAQHPQAHSTPRVSGRDGGSGSFHATSAAARPPSTSFARGSTGSRSNAGNAGNIGIRGSTECGMPSGMPHFHLCFGQIWALFIFCCFCFWDDVHMF